MFEIVDNEIIKGKEHYYESRFGIKNTNDPKFETIIYKYIEGL